LPIERSRSRIRRVVDAGFVVDGKATRMSKSKGKCGCSRKKVMDVMVHRIIFAFMGGKYRLTQATDDFD